MAILVGPGAAVLRCALLLLCLGAASCQDACSAVDCPPLHNCIEEAAPQGGACCPACLQRGCTCEGYQYYDCLSAGFRGGRVPEGDSYFVDYGSTECSCPAGGGRISCHFIGCPEVPPNCIEVSEPGDGCAHCERVGCAQGGRKFEAGHSFRVEPCRVCHCPDQGGELMCYPVPDCDPESEGPAPEGDPFSYGPPPGGNLPLFRPSALDGEEEEEDYDYGPTGPPEVYPQSLLLPSPSDGVPSAPRGSAGGGAAPPFWGLERQSKLELRERHGVRDHPAGRGEEDDPPGGEPPSPGVTSVLPTAESSPEGPEGPEGPLPGTSDEGQWGKGPRPDATSESATPDEQDSREPGGQISISQPDGGGGGRAQTHRWSDFQMYTTSPGGATASHQAGSSGRADLQGTATPGEEETEETEGEMEGETEEEIEKEMEGEMEEEMEGEMEEEMVTPPSVATSEGATPEPTTLEPTTLEPTTPEPDHHRTTTTARLLTTTAPLPPAGARPGEGRPSREPDQRLLDVHGEDGEEVEEEVAEGEGEEEEEEGKDWPEEGLGVPAEDPLQGCCAAGQRWASENHRCSHMPPLDSDEHSMCSAVQRHCCLSSVKEGHCELGMTSARRGDACEVDQGDQCADDSYQVCCSCCALGSRARGEGRGCGAHRYLGDPCDRAFLACCEGSEGGPSRTPLTRRQRPRPTALPRKVSDSVYPKEAFSISATDEAANAVEEQRDVDECRLYAGQLCQHTCVNVWGSYRCECHQGYILQQDRHSCTPVSPDEDNRVREDSPAVAPSHTTTTTTTTATTGTTSTTTTSPAPLSPCAENGPCSQQCTVVSGRVHCSCFPGFSLMTDGRLCEDVDECVTRTHSCRPSERCVNTVGSFVCEPQATCPAGYQLRNGVCEDVDECALRTHDCGAGYVCENVAGSFLCRPKHKCIAGFTQDSHGNCIDINECSSLAEPCSSGFNCVNTVGSFSCQQKSVACSHGYRASPDGGKCVDIDECQMGTHHCGVGQICHNLPGSYRCDCQTGYQYDALRKTCADVNECWRYPGRLCAQTCENTPGSYHCSCTAGFSLAFDGKNCEDVNECEKNPCSQECANIYGSYQCYCRQGYYLKEDGHTCEDIDECSQSIGNLCSFQCVNVAGSYQCACPKQGYVMTANGRTCRDIDECTTGTHNCSHGQNCFNLQGGFRCLSFDCPPNYKRASDTRCERTSCPSNSVDCQNSPVRITYYQLSFQTNIIIPAQIFRIGPSPTYSGDHISIGITRGNKEGYFSTRKLNSFMGAVYLQRQVQEPKDFLIDVEMKLLRQGTLTSFLARIYVFITASTM